MKPITPNQTDNMPGEDRETFKPNEPDGWIQWKGTNVCMDVHCKCGALGHVDAEYAYYVQCQACGQVYWCNPNIELVPLTDDESARMHADHRVKLAEVQDDD